MSPYGYTFTLNDEAYYPTTICRYPAAFLSQPEFVSLEGRKRGRITYKVVLRLARQGAKLTAAERTIQRAEMEQQLAEIFISLSRAERVAVVRNLTIKPTAQAIDCHGAMAMEAQAEVETIF